MKTGSYKLSAISAAMLASLSAQTFSAPPSAGAYTIDQTQSYVEDATSQGIRLPNTVLCYMNGTGGNQSAVLNGGDYIALVDKNKCENASGAVNNSASGNAGASSAPDYMTGIINATRTNDSSPLIGKVWFLENAMHQGMGTTTGVIYARLTATAAPSATEPYGHFHTDFCGLPTGSTSCTTQAPFYGYAEGNGATVSAFQGGTDQQVHVTLSGTVDSGNGRVQFAQAGGGPSGDWAFAFDSSYFLRADNGGGNAQCFDRLASNAERTAWSYGVYDGNGARLERTSGFPIKLGSSNGYVGYWGLWLPAGVTASDGDAVTRFSYGNNQASSATYTLVQKNGRLKKLDLHTTTLGAIANVPIMWWADHNFTDSNSVARAQGDVLEIRWDGSSFRITGSVTNGQSGQTIVPDPACGDVTNGSYSIQACADITGELQNAWVVSGWSQSLGGQVTIVTRDSAGVQVTLATDSVVTYRTESVVTPGGAGWPTTLHCVSDCPAGGQTFIDGLNGSGSPYLSFTGGATSQWNWSPVAAADALSYTANATTGLLEANGSAVQWTASTAPSSPQYSWGFQSGRMVDDTGLPSLACNANGSSATPADHYCQNRIEGVSTLYVWETGPNSWNRFTGLKDSNSHFVQFDPPLQLSYAVQNTGTVFDGSTLILQYNGFGDLQGIPGKCINPVTNAEVQCDPNGTTRWVAAFAMTAGDVVTNGPTSYYVKPLQQELRLRRVAANLCTDPPRSLTPPTNVGLPTASAWNDPYVANGPKPSLPTSAPRVIDGLVQY